MLRNRPALFGLAIILVFVVLAILAPFIAPYDPLARDPGQVFKPPSAAHLMGTDKQAHDMFSRILFGARISLFVGVVSVIMGLAMGGTIGAIAGAFGGRVDSVLMRIVDVLLAIPGILLAIGIVVWLDRGLLQIMFAVAATNAPIFARILRGSMLALRESDYVTAARSIGRADRPDAPAPHAAERADPDHRRQHAGAGDRDHRRRGSRVPRPRPGRSAHR